ncbi:methionine/alanine import family NSS transporter small subunit [Moraxella oblonga]|nr:methionine/alanine import family NSS transporter small subunit [Moraxella oblonga]
MNGSALIVMLIAMVLIWGGLILSVIHLIKNPDIALDDVKNE